MTLDPSHFINRELSWLEFNQRVLDEAKDKDQPLLERMKYLGIVSSNLDEFFEIRVSGLKQQEESGGEFENPDGMTPAEQLEAISRRTHRLVADQYEVWRKDLLPALKENGLHFLQPDELTPAEKQWVARYFSSRVEPVLTPLVLDPAHPFPLLLNKSLNLALELADKKSGRGKAKTSSIRLGLVQVPRSLPRVVQLPDDTPRRSRFLFLADLIRLHAPGLFPGRKCLGVFSFRVTRNSNLYVDEEDSDNLLKTIEGELQRRRRGEAVRLEIEKGVDAPALDLLAKSLGLGEPEVYQVDGPVNMQRFLAVYHDLARPDLKDTPYLPAVPAVLRGPKVELFDAIRQRDLCLHHPYESFTPVMEFISRAAQDSQVLAIKQTFYRTSGDSPLVHALMAAARNGKQVTVLLELKARFEEENNIQLARRMEEAGVHVVYGLVGLKTHCKMALVVRQEPEGLVRYVHLGTGNYNPRTARLYTDLGLFTVDPALGRDVSALFNALTAGTASRMPDMEKLLVAPRSLGKEIRRRIEREAVHARQGKPAWILAKMNSLADPEVIESLYDASRAGVKIRLCVRGICCLRPGVKGLSENIQVTSVVDRYLEHSRIYFFGNAGHPEVWVGSADWMPRNFQRRMEVLFPVEAPALKERVCNILAYSLADNVKARRMDGDGRYQRVAHGPKDLAVRSQQCLMDLAQGLPAPPAVLPGWSAPLEATS
jgi:polyphosphate kinase